MEHKKDTICLEAPNLSRDDKIEILRIIYDADSSKIREFEDGLRINLNLLAEDVIHRIYMLICCRLGAKK